MLNASTETGESGRVSTLSPVPLWDWMIRRHYLRRWPGVVTLTLGMRCGLDYVGVIVFALPPRETAQRYGGVTWELARLWIEDRIPRNAESWLIGRAIKYIRANHQQVRFLVSYADPTFGHSGGIYKASNWKSDGLTKPASDYECQGRRFSRYSHAPAEAIRVPRVSKWRFFYEV